MIIICKPKEGLKSNFRDLLVMHTHNVFTIGAIPCSQTHFPKTTTALAWSVHFGALEISLCLLNLLNKMPHLLKTRSAVSSKHAKLSQINTIIKTSRYSCRTTCFKCMDYEGALIIPKGINRNSSNSQSIPNGLLGMPFS